MSFFGDSTYFQVYTASGGKDVIVTPTGHETTSLSKDVVKLTNGFIQSEIDDAYNSVMSQIEGIMNIGGKFSTTCESGDETIILTATSIDNGSNPTIYFIGEGSVKIKGKLIKYLSLINLSNYVAVEYEEVSGGGGATIVQSGNTLSIS